MVNIFRICVIAIIVLAVPLSLSAQTDKVKYVPKYDDPILEKMKEATDSLRELRDSITESIRDVQDSLKETEEDAEQKLRFDFIGVTKPPSPEVFDAEFHFPPVAQYRTGTCWCFSATSFLESEVFRLTGQKIKLSEMHTVYYEYVEKARYFVRRRGDYRLGQGSESNAVLRMIKLYGAVPYDVYPGFIDDDQHDHFDLSKEIRSYLEYVKEQDIWDEEYVLQHIKTILNRYLGEPPTAFQYDGQLMTPHVFVDEVLQVSVDDYVSIMSTLSIPFYTQGEYDAPDNWWRDSSYYNLPLDEWYGTIVDAIDNGYTLVIGGDVSEPGWNGFEDAAIVPDFDIPQAYINQDSREYRIYYDITFDDHGVHMIGHIVIDGRDWFLAKDSGRSARWGQFEGYYFLRDDYIRLKMLTATVHKDMIENILPKFESSSDEG